MTKRQIYNLSMTSSTLSIKEGAHQWTGLGLLCCLLKQEFYLPDIALVMRIRKLSNFLS